MFLPPQVEGERNDDDCSQCDEVAKKCHGSSPLIQQRLKFRHDEVDGDLIIAALRHNNIRVAL